MTLALGFTSTYPNAPQPLVQIHVSRDDGIRAVRVFSKRFGYSQLLGADFGSIHIFLHINADDCGVSVYDAVSGLYTRNPTLDDPLSLGRPPHRPTPQVIHLPVGLTQDLLGVGVDVFRAVVAVGQWDRLSRALSPHFNDILMRSSGEVQPWWAGTMNQTSSFTLLKSHRPSTRWYSSSNRPDTRKLSPRYTGLASR